MPELGALNDGVMGGGSNSAGQGGMAIDFGGGGADLSSSDVTALAADFSITNVMPSGYEKAAISEIQDSEGNLIGMIQTGTPLGKMPLSALLEKFGYSIQHNGLGFIIYGPNNDFAGYFSGNVPNVTIMQGFEMTSELATLPDGTVVNGMALEVASQLVGFTDSNGSAYVTPTQIMAQPGLVTAASGAYVANSGNITNFWTNKSSYFSWEVLTGEDGLYSTLVGNRLLPYSQGGGVNFSGFLMTKPQMMLMGVAASGYCVLYGENDPWNIIDPTTNELLDVVSWVWVNTWDGSRQFSADASWGYKGQQPTDTMTLASYTNPNNNPASNAGPDGGPN